MRVEIARRAVAEFIARAQFLTHVQTHCGYSYGDGRPSEDTEGDPAFTTRFVLTKRQIFHKETYFPRISAPRCHHHSSVLPQRNHCCAYKMYQFCHIGRLSRPKILAELFGGFSCWTVKVMSPWMHHRHGCTIMLRPARILRRVPSTVPTSRPCDEAKADLKGTFKCRSDLRFV